MDNGGNFAFLAVLFFPLVFFLIHILTKQELLIKIIWSLVLTVVVIAVFFSPSGR